MNAERPPSGAYIPGGPFPRPADSRQILKALGPDRWKESADYLHGFALFNDGYYWEAHEVWEGLWHAAGRTGAVADLLRGLIKLAAAGVKVRQNQPHGVVVHATRAAAVFDAARVACGDSRLMGLDLNRLSEIARSIADSRPTTDSTLNEPAVCVFEFFLSPSQTS